MSTHTFLVTVDTPDDPTDAQAREAISQRLDFEDELGFNYLIEHRPAPNTLGHVASIHHQAISWMHSRRPYAELANRTELAADWRKVGDFDLDAANILLELAETVSEPCSFDPPDSRFAPYSTVSPYALGPCLRGFSKLMASDFIEAASHFTQNEITTMTDLAHALGDTETAREWLKAWIVYEEDDREIEKDSWHVTEDIVGFPIAQEIER